MLHNAQENYEVATTQLIYLLMKLLICAQKFGLITFSSIDKIK